MQDEPMNGEQIEEALEERVEWINAIAELAVDGNWQSVQRAVDDLDDKHVRDMVYVLLLARGGDLKTFREFAEKAEAAPLN
jgi:hypothetical protein